MLQSPSPSAYDRIMASWQASSRQEILRQLNDALEGFENDFSGMDADEIREMITEIELDLDDVEGGRS